MPNSLNTPLFQVGDVVYLASGSPGLTIMAIAGDIATCSWFLGGGKYRHTADFPLATLIKGAKPRSSSPSKGE